MDGPVDVRYIVARFAALYVNIDDVEFSSGHSRQLVERVTAAFSRDPRVSAIVEAPNDARAFRGTYPRIEDGEQIALDPLAHKFTPDFSTPYVLQLRVPIKNQPTLGFSDPPTDTYLVVWNGLTLLVLWEQNQGDDIGDTWGRVALQVLEGALNSFGLAAAVQPPYMPDTSVVISCGKSSQTWLLQVRENSTIYEMAVPESEWIPELIARRLFARVDRVVDSYYTVSNVVDRIVCLQMFLEEDIDSIAKSQYERRLLRNRWLPVQIWRRWRIRDWRRDVETRIARLTLALTAMARLKTALQSDVRSYGQDIADAEFELRHRVTTEQQQEAMSLDLTLVENLLARAEQRMDNLVLTRVTMAGALVGAAFGAIAGALVGHLLR
jgi:hypothetical protein